MKLQTSLCEFSTIRFTYKFQISQEDCKTTIPGKLSIHNFFSMSNQTQSFNPTGRSLFMDRFVFSRYYWILKKRCWILLPRHVFCLKETNQVFFCSIIIRILLCLQGVKKKASCACLKVNLCALSKIKNTWVFGRKIKKYPAYDFKMYASLGLAYKNLDMNWFNCTNGNNDSYDWAHIGKIFSYQHEGIFTYFYLLL